MTHVLCCPAANRSLRGLHPNQLDNRMFNLVPVSPIAYLGRVDAARFIDQRGQRYVTFDAVDPEIAFGSIHQEHNLLCS